MAIARRITVGTSATVLNPADDGLDGERITVINPDKIGGVTNTTDLFVGGADVDTVDGAGGKNIRLGPGDSFTDQPGTRGEQWFGRVASGTLVVSVATGGA